MQLTEQTVTCLTCRHYDVVIIPPATQPIGQCWSPHDWIVGAWYRTQSRAGWGSIVANCEGWQPHNESSPNNQSGR